MEKVTENTRIYYKVDFNFKSLFNKYIGKPFLATVQFFLQVYVQFYLQDYLKILFTILSTSIYNAIYKSSFYISIIFPYIPSGTIDILS